VKLVGRIDLIGQAQHRVFEGQKGSRVYVQLNVQIDRPTASVLRVKVNFPRLTQRVRLNEVPFVVDVKAVGHRVIFKVGNESCNVYGGHYHSG
jgi:hypothetical protein